MKLTVTVLLIILLIAGLTLLLSSCSNDRTVKIIATGEKTIVIVPRQYQKGDTIHLTYSSTRGAWQVDTYWVYDDPSKMTITLETTQIWKGVIIK
jgi:hypothetical protein